MDKFRSHNRYLSTISAELLARCDRVRTLIGNKHWQTDGHHKESLLIGVLKRHLPVGVIACRGFLVSPVDDDACSTEQDILLLDVSAQSPLFFEDGVAIAFPTNLIGAISVKSTLTKATLKDALDGLQTLDSVPDGQLQRNKFWKGAFFYSESKTVAKDPAIVRKYLTEFGDMQDWSRICSVPDLLMVRRELEESIKYLGYLCDGLSAAYFIGDLLDHISELRNGTGAAFARALDSATPEQF